MTCLRSRGRIVVKSKFLAESSYSVELTWLLWDIFNAIIYHSSLNSFLLFMYQKKIHFFLWIPSDIIDTFKAGKLFFFFQKYDQSSVDGNDDQYFVGFSQCVWHEKYWSCNPNITRMERTQSLILYEACYFLHLVVYWCSIPRLKKGADVFDRLSTWLSLFILIFTSLLLWPLLTYFF